MVGKAVGYVRCSTDMQEDSPEQQRKEILAFADQRGLEIIEWFEDVGKSGTTFDYRPAIQRLIKICENGRYFDTIICYDESRWGRSEENQYWRMHLRRHGVNLRLVKTSVDSSNPMAGFIQVVEGFQASQYSQNLSSLTLRGAKHNRRYSNGGSAPYGYVRIAVNKKTGATRPLSDGEYSIKGQEKVGWGHGIEHEIATVKTIFKKRSQGDSYAQIAAFLNAQSIPAPRRGRWKDLDDVWSTGTIRGILENHAYYGTRVYNRNSMSRIRAEKEGRMVAPGVRYPHWLNPPSEWTIEEDAHPPIVDKDLWQRANSVTPPKLREGSKPHRDVPYLLTGLIFCTRCSKPFQGQSTKSKNKRYYKYICGGYNKRICEYCAIKRDEIEPFVMNAIKETLSSPVLLKLIEHKLRALQSSSPDSPDQRTIDRSILIQESSARNLADAIAEHGASPTLMSQLQTVEREIENLKRQKERIEKLKQDKGLIDEVGSRVEDFILNFEERIARVPVHEKKDLIRRIVSKIEVDRDANVVRCYVRKVPAVSPEIEEMYQRAENAQRLQKRRCAKSLVAGTHTFDFAQLSRVFEYQLS